MASFDAQDPDFEASVRESFGSLALMRTIGARLLSVAPGEVQIDLPFRADLTQHHGFLAAAVLTSIVDVACGYAAMTLMAPGASVLTVEYKVNFLSPAQGDRMLARGRVIRPGRTVTVCAGDVLAVNAGDHRGGSHQPRGPWHQARAGCVCREGRRRQRRNYRFVDPGGVARGARGRGSPLDS
jgi:uncharacterized protein (TIGR00369 family)